MKKPTIIMLISTVFFPFFTSCNKGCAQKTERIQSVDIETPSNELKEKTFAPKITTFSQIDMSGLEDSQKANFIKFLNDEICPCGCPKTFAQCVEMPGCEASLKLARWGIEQLKEGVAERALFAALSNEINQGFMADLTKIDLNKGQMKGNKDALVTIVEFADFECPACKVASKGLAEFFNDNKKNVRLYFMHFPLSMHENAERAAVASEAAGRQGKFWPMHDLLFASEKSLSEDAIMEIAGNLFNKSSMKKFMEDFKDEKLWEKVREQKNYALNELKLGATPTIFFNGRPFNLVPSKEGFYMRFEMERLRDKINCK